MNIPPPMTEKTFLETQSKVGSVYINVAESDMKSAAEEIKEIESRPEVNADIHNTIISTDSTGKDVDFPREMVWYQLFPTRLASVLIIVLSCYLQNGSFYSRTSKKQLIMALCVTY